MLKLSVSCPISLWFTKLCLWWWTYSIGSSNVIICLCWFSFIMSIRLARVVLLPLPVGPVTKTRPLCFSVKVFRTSGSPNVSNEGIWDVIVLIAIA